MQVFPSGFSFFRRGYRVETLRYKKGSDMTMNIATFELGEEITSYIFPNTIPNGDCMTNLNYSPSVNEDPSGSVAILSTMNSDLIHA